MRPVHTIRTGSGNKQTTVQTIVDTYRHAAIKRPKLPRAVVHGWGWLFFLPVSLPFFFVFLPILFYLPGENRTAIAVVTVR